MKGARKNRRTDAYAQKREKVKSQSPFDGMQKKAMTQQKKNQVPPLPISSSVNQHISAEDDDTPITIRQVEWTHFGTEIKPYFTLTKIEGEHNR